MVYGERSTYMLTVNGQEKSHIIAFLISFKSEIQF